MMSFVRILLIMTAIFVVLRTFFRIFGKKIPSQHQKVDAFMCSVICFCVFLVIKAKIFLIFALLGAIFVLINHFFQNKESLEDTILDFLDQVLLNMRSGLSFETALG